MRYHEKGCFHKTMVEDMENASCNRDGQEANSNDHVA